MPTAYALIHEEGGVFGISFPDFPGVVSTSRSPDEVLGKGSEALSFHVAGMAEDGDPLPALRSLAELAADPEYRRDAKGAVVALVAFEKPGKAYPAPSLLDMKRVMTHPGEVLLHDCLKPVGMSARKFAEVIGVPAKRVSAIIAGRRSVTADTAIRIARYFGTTPEFWLNMQNAHDLSKAVAENAREYERIKTRKPKEIAA